MGISQKIYKNPLFFFVNFSKIEAENAGKWRHFDLELVYLYEHFYLFASNHE